MALGFRVIQYIYIGLRDITPIMENEMEKNMENEMDTGGT